MTVNEITYEIRGAIYEVYKTLGPGLLESVYEEGLTFELQQRGLKVERQVQVPIEYKGNTLKTELRFIELKSVKELLDVHFKQTLTYCKLLNKRIGILVNFYVDDILDNAIHRIVNNL